MMPSSSPGSFPELLSLSAAGRQVVMIPDLIADELGPS
jgi:hypothetical protein